jgi:hypothetical protein
MELNREKKMKSEQAVLPNPCLEEEEKDILFSYMLPLSRVWDISVCCDHPEWGLGEG